MTDNNEKTNQDASTPNYKPSFLELLKGIWNKIKAGQVFSTTKMQPPKESPSEEK